jgi:fibronectin type 3 domain-containing protein
MSSDLSFGRGRWRAAAVVLSLLSALALLPLLACGKKGDPAPPLRAVPTPTRDLVVAQRGTQLLFAFGFPKTTVAGQALAGLSQVELWEVIRPYQSASAPLRVEMREFNAASKRIVSLEGEQVAAATSGDRVFLDLPLADPLPQAEARTYSVRTTSTTGEQSTFSNLVGIAPGKAPAPPESTTVQPQAEGVLIEWTVAAAPAVPEVPAPAEVAPAVPPAEPAETPAATAEGAIADAADTAPTPAALKAPTTVGFNIYRRGSQVRTWGPPLQILGPHERRFVDTTARFGESYIYAVTTVARRGPLIESAIQSEHEVRYVDRFAPPPPTSAVALPATGRMRVVWQASEVDATGYLVYRREGRRSGAAAEDFRKLTANPLTTLEFTDTDVTAGTTYIYRVTAVDEQGNESPPAEARAIAE